jgi:hypothetical protein
METIFVCPDPGSQSRSKSSVQLNPDPSRIRSKGQLTLKQCSGSYPYDQCCGSGLYADSMGSSGPGGQNDAQKSKKVNKFVFLMVFWGPPTSPLAWTFFYGSLGISGFFVWVQNRCTPHFVRGQKLLSEPCFCHLITICGVWINFGDL